MTRLLHPLTRTCGALLLCLPMMTAALAASPPLFNTGLSANGSSILPTGAIDTHFTVTGPGYSNAPTYAVNDALGFAGVWLAPSSTSKWITPLVTSDFGGDVSAGSYTYTTTFDLTGFNPTTGSLSGAAGADNEITSISINGAAVAFPSGVGYSSLAPFITSGSFVAGINTLRIVVNNFGGPSGLRAELSGNFTATAVPEPGGAALMLAGLALFGWTARRSQRI